MDRKHRDILLRKLQGSATAEEDAQFNSWVKESPELENEYHELLHVWKVTSDLHTSTEPQTDFLWNRIENRLKQESTVVHGIPSRNTRRQFFTPLRITFAGSCIAAVLILFFMHRQPALELRNVKCSSGKTLTVTLLEGTQVTLHDSSEVIYSPTIENDAVRKVSLDGEATFRVAHNGHPFHLITSNTMIEVVGTTFHVFAHPNITSLIVEEGRVHFRSLKGDSSIVRVVSAGYRSECEGNSIPIQPMALAGAEKQSIDDHIFIYEHSTLASIAKELEVAYGVKITISSDRLAQRIISARFENRTLDEVLTVLCSVADAKYRKKDPTSIEISE